MKQLGLLCLAALLVSGPATAEELTDDQIRQLLIEQSIRSYSGSCACPYNRARNGSKCGKRSAYSKPGGASPLCYKHDVSDAMVEDYRRKQKR